MVKKYTDIFIETKQSTYFPTQTLFTGPGHTFLAATSSCASSIEITLPQRLCPHLMIDFGFKTLYQGRHIQQQLLLQNTPGVRLKLSAGLPFLPLHPWPASLTSDVPISAHFGLSISVLSSRMSLIIH